MADTYPPSNLAPDAAPWGRAIQEGVVNAASQAEIAKTGMENFTAIQKLQGEQIVTGLAAASRDTKAVNDELFRVYTELQAVDALHKSRLDGHDTKLAEHQAELSRQNGVLYDHAVELFDHNSRLNSQDSRIGALEAKLTFRTATSIDGLEFLADGGSGAIWKVPQSVGSPLGGPIKWPFPLQYVTDDFGPRESPGGIGSTYHYGYDFSGGGTDIKAVGRGTVVEAGPNGGLGNWVKIRHSPTLETGYGHMVDGSIKVSIGQAVSQGQSIGTMGTTGTSTGVHLHFETHVMGERVNPRDVIVGDESV